MSDEHMSDKDMDAVLREWTQDAPAGQPDRSRVVGDVVRQLGSTSRRRRRWWLQRLFSRKPDEPAAVDNSDYQPSPIPATNGHTPTVIGRTTSMLSPVKAITAGALVFAVGGAFLIAQPFGQQGSSVPGADVEDATTQPIAPVIVTGSMLGVGEPVQEPVEAVVDGVIQGRGSVMVGDQFEADDPRLTGSSSQTVNGDGRMIGDTAAFLISPLIRIENDEGAWSGQCDLLVIADGDPDPFACLFNGEDAYDGLSAYLVFENPEQPPNPFKGLIFEGDLPPVPEFPATE